MKTKLLKKLRKKADDNFYVVKISASTKGFGCYCKETNYVYTISTNFEEVVNARLKLIRLYILEEIGKIYKNQEPFKLSYFQKA